MNAAIMALKLSMEGRRLSVDCDSEACGDTLHDFDLKIHSSPAALPSLDGEVSQFQKERVDRRSRFVDATTLCRSIYHSQ